MTTVNIFQNPNYQILFQEFKTLKKIDIDRGDKLAVRNGVLEISTGGFLQAPTRTLKNLFYGGYNREAVVSHLGKLAAKAEEFYKTLQTELQKDPHQIPSYGIEVKKFAKTIRKVNNILVTLHQSYKRIQAYPASKDTTCIQLCAPAHTFNSISDSLKKELKSKKWENLQKPPKKPIDLTAPINLKKIKKRMPSGQTPKETLELAKAAERQIEPCWKRTGDFVLFVLGLALSFYPLLILTVLKWTVWNPIEYCLTGRIKTENPFAWYASNSNIVKHIFDKDEAKEAIKKYANQLLSVPVITEEHVRPFCELAPYVTSMGSMGNFAQAKLGSKDIYELWSLLNVNKPHLSPSKLGEFGQPCLGLLLAQSKAEAITASIFQDIIEELYFKLCWIDHPDAFGSLEKLSEEIRVSLDSDAPDVSECPNGESDDSKFSEFSLSYLQLRSLEMWKQDFAKAQNEGFQDTPQDRQRYFLENISKDNPFEISNSTPSSRSSVIAPSEICKIIEAIGRHSSCSFIVLPREADKLLSIQYVLAKYGFIKDVKYAGQFYSR